MPSLHETIFATLAAPVQAYVFDETITHRPSGSAASAVDVDATFWLDEPAESETGGRHNEHRATIRVASTLTLTFDDTWVVNDVLWSTVTIGKDQGDGLIEVGVTTISPNLRMGARERI